MIIYTKNGCPWCAEVLKFLRDNKIAFEEREVLSNEDFLEELKVKSGQSKTPTLDLNGEILADADVQAVQKFLKERNLL